MFPDSPALSCSPFPGESLGGPSVQTLTWGGYSEGLHGKHKWILFLTSCEVVSIPCTFGEYRDHQGPTRGVEFLMPSPTNAGQHDVVTLAYFITDQTLVGSCCKLVTVSSAAAAGLEAWLWDSCPAGFLRPPLCKSLFLVLWFPTACLVSLKCYWNHVSCIYLPAHRKQSETSFYFPNRWKKCGFR